MNAESRPAGNGTAPKTPAKKSNASVDVPADTGRDAARGIVVPVVVDQHGRLLDGHHRRAVAADLDPETAAPVKEALYGPVLDWLAEPDLRRMLLAQPVDGDYFRQHSYEPVLAWLTGGGQ